MNTLVNLLKKNSVFNKNKWTLVAISIVFFIGLYWYYKKSKENFGIEVVSEEMDQPVVFKSDDRNIDLDNGLSKNMIQSKILYNKINSLNVNEVLNNEELKKNMDIITGIHDTMVANADNARTNQDVPEQFSTSNIESVEFNLYTSGACELSADYKKQYEAIIDEKQYGKFNETNVTVYDANEYKSKKFLHFINFNVIECELVNLTTNLAGWDEGIPNGAVITDAVKRKCTLAGVGYFEKQILRPTEDPEEEPINELPLLEFKIKGKYYDVTNGIEIDFTVTYYFNKYEEQLGLTSGSTTDLKANMLAWMKHIEYIIGAKDEKTNLDVLEVFAEKKFPS